MAFNLPVNLQTVYVSACCLSMKEVFKTREEAAQDATNYEQHIWGGNYERGYVIEFPPGSLSESSFHRGMMCKVDDEDAGEGYAQESFNYLGIPEWLRMGNLATARPRPIRK